MDPRLPGSVSVCFAVFECLFPCKLVTTDSTSRFAPFLVNTSEELTPPEHSHSTDRMPIDTHACVHMWAEDVCTQCLVDAGACKLG